jgi:ribosomal protein S18 acetylase RimI-like enzyme
MARSLAGERRAPSGSGVTFGSTAGTVEGGPSVLTVRPIDAQECDALTPRLSEILIDAIDGGASVSFLGPLSREDADSFWSIVASGVANGERLLLGAFDDAELVGTAQLVIDTPPNQPHRADIAKLLVHRSARRRGVGRQLMDALETQARAHGRTLLTLDAQTGSDAERLYASCGYVRVGTIPDYALLPKGGPAATTIFYKRLVDG